MPHTRVGSHTIYYDDHGSGQPLLLIPGLSNSRLIWWKQTGVFSKKYHLIQMDNRDAGDSSLGKGRTPSETWQTTLRASSATLILVQ